MANNQPRHRERVSEEEARNYASRVGHGLVRGPSCALLGSWTQGPMDRRARNFCTQMGAQRDPGIFKASVPLSLEHIA